MNVSSVGAAQVPAYFMTALGEYGVKEIPGPAHAPRILEYLRTCSIGPQGGDETPWCSAFCNWCMVHSSYRGTASAAARSWLAWGTRVTVPYVGAVTVLSRHDPKNPNAGHVGFFVRREGTNVWLLSGNQSNSVCIEPYPIARILEFRGA
jgi:uncharacterized protein (TIGR02594 family)